MTQAALSGKVALVTGGDRGIGKAISLALAAAGLTLASASDHPDFSRNGTRIEVGFMRLYSVPAGSPGGSRIGEIDNWRLTFHR